MRNAAPRPLVMVAPNGARRAKTDHAELPLTIAEIVATARACHQAGADALHAHLRDGAGRHVLDSGLYAELLAEMALVVPDMAVQITTEAGGLYTPAEQRALLDVTGASALSAAVREITADDDTAAQRRFYHTAAERGMEVQHIVYAPEEIDMLGRLIADGIVPDTDLSVLFVLGSYAGHAAAQPDELEPFLEWLRALGLPAGRARFMACAFGARETDCLLAAARKGGDCRVGFENNLHHADGTLAADNAARVAAVRKALAEAELRELPG